MRGFTSCARRILPATVLLLSTTLPATAEVDGLRLSAGRVVSAAGEVCVPLGSGETLTALRGDAAGWIVAGVQRSLDQDGDAERSRLTLWRGDADRAVELPAPATRGRWLGAPSVLGDAADPSGIAWLEGGDRERAAVRWATWNGAGWSAATTVSALGPGAQLGLGASRLEDGRVLLVWSRYDGEDDEIYWSVGGAGGFSAPARLEADDRVPDMTPAVTAVAGGALAAWSAYDPALFEYRVMASRFDGRVWSAPQAVGPPGSLYPSFETGAERRPLLLYRTAAPRGWQLIELDAAGRSLRRADAASLAPERPVARLDGDRPVLFFAERTQGLDWQPLALGVATESAP